MKYKLLLLCGCVGPHEHSAPRLTSHLASVAPRLTPLFPTGAPRFTSLLPTSAPRSTALFTPRHTGRCWCWSGWRWSGWLRLRLSLSF
jgi:hypothetical protein